MTFSGLELFFSAFSLKAASYCSKVKSNWRLVAEAKKSRVEMEAIVDFPTRLKLNWITNWPDCAAAVSNTGPIFRLARHGQNGQNLVFGPPVQYTKLARARLFYARESARAVCWALCEFSRKKLAACDSLHRFIILLLCEELRITTELPAIYVCKRAIYGPEKAKWEKELHNNEWILRNRYFLQNMCF